jgi:hypothetical protein
MKVKQNKRVEVSFSVNANFIDDSLILKQKDRPNVLGVYIIDRFVFLFFSGRPRFVTSMAPGENFIELFFP